MLTEQSIGAVSTTPQYPRNNQDFNTVQSAPLKEPLGGNLHPRKQNCGETRVEQIRLITVDLRELLFDFLLAPHAPWLEQSWDAGGENLLPLLRHADKAEEHGAPKASGPTQGYVEKPLCRLRPRSSPPAMNLAQWDEVSTVGGRPLLGGYGSTFKTQRLPLP